MSCEILVIGGGPAGLSAAINARARGRSVLVVSNPLEENPLWRAEKVENYLGMPGRSGAGLLREMRSHAERDGVLAQFGSFCGAFCINYAQRTKNRPRELLGRHGID